MDFKTKAPLVLIVEDDRLSFANPAFARMLGYSVSGLLRKKIRDIIVPGDVPTLRRADGIFPCGSQEPRHDHG